MIYNVIQMKMIKFNYQLIKNEKEKKKLIAYFHFRCNKRDWYRTDTRMFKTQSRRNKNEIIHYSHYGLFDYSITSN